MENTRPHYPVPEVPEGKIILHDDVLHWLVKHGGNHIKELTPDVGSEELRATTAHANAVAKWFVLQRKGRRESVEVWWDKKTWKIPCGRILEVLTLSSRKKTPNFFHRRYFKKLYNNFQIVSSLLFVNYPVEPCSQKLIRCIQVQQAE